MAFELVPFSDVKALLGDLSGDTYADHPDLDLLQKRLQYSFEEYIGRELESTERTETVFIAGTPRKMVSLKGLPVSEVSQVRIQEESADWVTLTDGSWVVTSYGICLHNFAKNTQVEVTYTGGLSATTGGLKAAALYQLTYEFQSKDQVGAESVTTEGGTVDRPELGLLKETKRSLRPYIHPLKIGGLR